MPRVDRQEMAAIVAGGAAGALLRVALARTYVSGHADWPWVTFAVNLAGAFLLGYFATRLQERLPLSAYRRPLLGTGFCGALTTFSTWMFETQRLAEEGEAPSGAANVAISLAVGLGAVALGRLIGSHL